MGLDITERTKARFKVAEGINGTFYYHLQHFNSHFGLCGDRVMHTSIPLSAWGSKTHINERWCSRCESIAKEIENGAVP
jgi:hypothetical protein